MKFGQLIECNIWNIFLEKSDAKYGGEVHLRDDTGIIYNFRAVSYPQIQYLHKIHKEFVPIYNIW